MQGQQDPSSCILLLCDGLIHWRQICCETSPGRGVRKRIAAQPGHPRANLGRGISSPIKWISRLWPSRGGISIPFIVNPPGRIKICGACICSADASLARRRGSAETLSTTASFSVIMSRVIGGVQLALTLWVKVSTMQPTGISKMLVSLGGAIASIPVVISILPAALSAMRIVTRPARL